MVKKYFLIIIILMIANFFLAGERATENYIKNLKTGNSKQKQIAAQELGKLRDEASISALEEALNDPDAKVRKAVIEALIEIPGKKSILVLCKATEDGKTSNRKLAIGGIVKKYLPESRSGFKEIFSTILDLFSSKQEYQMIEPWVIVEKEVSEALIKNLYKDKNTSLAAVKAIHSLRIKAAVPDLIKIMKGDEELIIEILKTFADFEANVVGKDVLPFLISKNDKIVSYAAYCLGKIKYSPAIPNLIQLYNYSSDIKYQKYALLGLSLLAAREAQDILLKSLKSDDNDFKILAAEGLGRIANPSYTEDLARSFLLEKDEKVKLALDFALFKLGRKEHIINLIKAINSYPEIIKVYIIELGKDGFIELSRYLPNLENQEKVKFIKILGSSYNPDAIKYVEPYLNDQDIEVATTAFEAIKKLKKIESSSGN